MEITTIKPFLEYYQKIRARTRTVIAQIPADQINWTYLEGKFTFADLIRHLAAIERFMYAENVKQRPGRYPGHGKELADGYQDILAYMDQMHQESLQIFTSLSDQDLQKKCITPSGIQITVWKWLRAMIEHEIHHRGQIFIYLSMLEVKTTPIFGLTSEEVFDKTAK